MVVKLEERCVLVAGKEQGEFFGQDGIVVVFEGVMFHIPPLSWDVVQMRHR